MNAIVVSKAGLVAALALGAPAYALYGQYAGEPRPAVSPKLADRDEHREHRAHRRRVSYDTVERDGSSEPSPAPSAIPQDSVAFVGGGGGEAVAPPPAAVEATATPIAAPPRPGTDPPTQPPAGPTAYPTSDPVRTPSPSPSPSSKQTPSPSPAPPAVVVNTYTATGPDSYTWDGCTISWPYYTTDRYGAGASGDSSSILSHLSERFSANGYSDTFSVGNTVYVNDVPANQPTVSMTSNHGHTFSSTWAWPAPSSPTVEGGFSGDSQMLIVQHTSPCTIWESTGTAKTGSGYSAWTAGSYSAIESAGNEVFQNPPGMNPDGAGPTSQSNLIPDIKFEEVQAGEVNHALELVLPPCSPAGSSYVYPAARGEGIACASDQASMPYGATWLMAPTPLSRCDLNADPQSAAIIYALKHYGAVLLNTTGSTTNVVFYAANALGVRYPATSPYDAPALGRCHLLTDGSILPHSAILAN